MIHLKYVKSKTIPQIDVEINANEMKIKMGNKTKTFKIEYKKIKYHNDYIYKLMKTKLQLMKDRGLKHLINTQNISNIFFNDTKQLFVNIINK